MAKPTDGDSDTGSRDAESHDRSGVERRGNGSIPNGATAQPLPAVRQFILDAAASALVNRSQLASRAGLSFPDPTTGVFKRDIFAALGYPRNLGIEHYRGQYQRGDIAERLVEIYPRSTWIAGTTIQEDPDPEITTPFEEAVDSLVTRLSLWAVLQRADILSGLGRYSAILIGEPGDRSQELPRSSSPRPDSILYLAPYAEDRAEVEASDIDTDTSSPRYGLPLAYRISSSSSGTPETVHWSRVIHVAEGLLEDGVYGKPRLRAVWNRLLDYEKIVGGGAESAWKRMDPGMQVDIDPKTQLTQAEEDALEDEFDEYHHNLRRFVRTRGVEVTPLTSPVASFRSNADAVLDAICAAVGVPKRILMGSERGELASTQDRSNWADRIAERRLEFAQPLVRTLIDRLIDYGYLPTPESYDVLWPDIEELDESEKADVAVKLASANRAQAAAGGGLIVVSDEIRERVLGLEPMEDVDEDEAGVGGGGAIDGDIDSDGDDGVGDGDGDGDDGVITARSPRAAFDLTDSPPDEPEWRAVHRVADAHRDRLARVIARAYTAAARDIDREALVAGLERNRHTEAEDLLLDAITLAESTLLETLPAALSAVLADGALATLRAARSRGSFFRASSVADAPLRAAQFSASFDETNPRAVSWASERSSTLVTEIGPDTRDAIRALVARGLEEGIPPRKLARLLVQSVGLRTDQANAVANLAARMRAANPGTLVRAGNTRIRIPKTGVTEALIQKRTEEYAGRLLRQRGVLVARTETAAAANRGQVELWLQAEEAGTLDSDVERIWIVTPDERLRDEHAEMAGARAPLDQPFERPSGGSIEPGFDPNCRCGQGIVRKETAA